MLNILKIFLCLSFILILPRISFAQTEHFLSKEELNGFGFSNYESINPNLLIYPLKRIAEQIQLSLIFDKDKKRNYVYKLYEKRFKEFVFIINSDKDGFITFAGDRYNSFVGGLKENYPPGEQEIEQIRTYLKLLERLRDIFPANSANWQKIQQSIDTTRSLF